MFEQLRPSDSLVWTILWQSSAFLALGLAMSLVLRKRPARAHWVLLAAILAALISPALTETGRRLGWGLWATPAPAVETAVVSISGNANAPAFDRPAPPPSFFEAPRSVEIAPAVQPIARPFPWRSAFLISWAAASLLLLARLIASFVGGWRLARSAREVDDPAVRAWVEAAAGRLGSRAVPRVGRLSAVRCPAVWCWGRRPLLLLPENGEAEGVDWPGVFRHELAHWSRRDHIASLLGELLVCALPWHPLAWWSRGRLAQLAELACDDWVLADGISPADYAESLLALSPQSRSPTLAAVSSRRGLMARVRRILSESRREPTLGAPWTFAVCLTLLSAITALALAQARPAKAKADDEPKADQAATKTLRGEVVAPDGKPLAGATVAWVGRSRPPLPLTAMPRGMMDQWKRNETIAETRTDADGRFELTGPFFDEDHLRQNDGLISLMVAAPGYGLFAEIVPLGDMNKELMLWVPPQVPIRGRLLKPNGEPAAGVRATLISFRRDTSSAPVEWEWPGSPDKLPDFWPRPQVTDVDGRFTIEGAPEGMEAAVLLEHPDYAVDIIRVSMYRSLKEGDAVLIREDGAYPVKPTFTHTMKPERFVTGYLFDEETDDRVSGALVELHPQRWRGGPIRRTRTDAHGRYRFGGQAADGVYGVYFYSRPDSAYLPAGGRAARPAGGDALELEINLVMRRGVLIRGRVIDRDGNKPVAGAAVAYQPQYEMKTNLVASLIGVREGVRERWYNPAITDADGRFTITAEPGKGVIAVETSSDSYIRSPVELVVPSGQTIYPKGALWIDAPRKGEPEPLEFVVEVRKGVTLEARVVGPNGEPVESVTAMYPGIDASLFDVWNLGVEFPQGRFQIPGADPERTYRVFFTNVNRRLGAVADLKYDPAGKPIEIRLQPTAIIRGKIADPNGAPPGRRLPVSLSLLLSPERREYSRADLRFQSAAPPYGFVLGTRALKHNPDLTKADGAFQFDALIPGVGYYVTSRSAGQGGASVPVWDLKPGEVRDLGTVTLDQKEER